MDFMCEKALKKVWLLRRLRTLKLETEIILDFYIKEVRSILEYGVAVWHSGLTNKMSDQIERIQKICVNIILCDTEWNIPYFVGCTLLGIEPLCYRRTELCIKFIQKTSLNPVHVDLFSRNTFSIETRQEKLDYLDYNCRTQRYFKSPLCYLTRLLNLNPVKNSEE